MLCYTVHPTLGLSPIANTKRSIALNQTTPPTGPGGTASQIAFSQDGKHLVAAIKGAPPTPGYLAVWEFGSDYSLSADFVRVAPSSGGLLPFTLTPIPGKNAFFTADPGLGFEIFDFSGGFKNSSSSSAVAVAGQKAICWSAYSPQSGDYYLVDAGTSEVVEVSISSDLKGTVVKASNRFFANLYLSNLFSTRQSYQLPANSAPIDSAIASVGGKDFLVSHLIYFRSITSDICASLVRLGC